MPGDAADTAGLDAAVYALASTLNAPVGLTCCTVGFEAIVAMPLLRLATVPGAVC